MLVYLPSHPNSRKKIAKELSKKVLPKQLHVSVLEASKTIQPFLERMSCLDAPNIFDLQKVMSQLNIYAAPDKTFNSSFPPMNKQFKMKYHNSNNCVTVAKIQGWKTLALNAIEFEVLYLADDSGETVKENHELVKQPDGEWLFTY